MLKREKSNKRVLTPAQFSALERAYLDAPAKHTEVAALTGVPVSVCKRLWEMGDREQSQAPIRETVTAANESARQRAVIALREAEAEKTTALQLQDRKSLEDLATARQLANEKYFDAQTALTEHAAIALVEETRMVSAARANVMGVLAYSSKLLASMQKLVESAASQIGEMKFRDPSEVLRWLEKVQRIATGAAQAGDQIIRTERLLLGEPTEVSKQITEGTGQGAQVQSTEDAIATLTAAADMMARLRTQDTTATEGAIIEADYTEESGGQEG